jgi:hypothetical protein
LTVELRCELGVHKLRQRLGVQLNLLLAVRKDIIKVRVQAMEEVEQPKDTRRDRMVVQ